MHIIKGDLKLFMGFEQDTPDGYVCLEQTDCAAYPAWGIGQVQSKRASVVYSSGVLGMLSRRDAAHYLAEFARVLVPDGLVVVSVYDAHVLARLYIERGIALGVLCEPLIGESVVGSLWDEGELTRVMRLSGFVAVARVGASEYLGLGASYYERCNVNVCGCHIGLTLKGVKL